MDHQRHPKDETARNQQGRAPEAVDRGRERGRRASVLCGAGIGSVDRRCHAESKASRPSTGNSGSTGGTESPRSSERERRMERSTGRKRSAVSGSRPRTTLKSSIPRPGTTSKGCMSCSTSQHPLHPNEGPTQKAPNQDPPLVGTAARLRMATACIQSLVPIRPPQSRRFLFYADGAGG